ncbi:hypothetical protein NQ117_17465 [Paenibacillus sp. SC116]|uniref:hypothetical protein n=1 Tax=Paenibacillus sp. SC116 TaxID=2968986 RepID=UPI00215B301F|nr:hypothetical protein [Paenibacillus sp. SC116]MCR8845473.1 hypothetical protein [Paenibacillus sp. SC116]
MAGSFRWNIVGGIIGFLITTFAASMTNPLSTSIVRGLIGGVIWFGIVFGFRWVAHMLLQGSGEGNHSNQARERTSDTGRGQNIDYTTPDEQDLQAILTSSPVESSSSTAHSDQAVGFTPMNPPKLVTKPPLNDEQLAQAVRHLTQK